MAEMRVSKKSKSKFCAEAVRPMGLRNRLVFPVLQQQQRDDPRRRMGGLLDVDPGTAGGEGLKRNLIVTTSALAH